MNEVFFFDKMITPKIITFVYWLILLAVVVIGLTAMFGGYTTVGTFFKGLIGMILGLVGARIFCELLIVTFKMNEALQDIRNK